MIWKKESSHVPCHHPPTPHSEIYMIACSPHLISALTFKILLFNWRVYIIVLFKKKQKKKTKETPYGR